VGPCQAADFHGYSLGREVKKRKGRGMAHFMSGFEVTRVDPQNPPMFFYRRNVSMSKEHHFNPRRRRLGVRVVRQVRLMALGRVAEEHLDPVKFHHRPVGNLGPGIFRTKGPGHGQDLEACLLKNRHIPIIVPQVQQDLYL
jgi:hypothetical protein